MKKTLDVRRLLCPLPVIRLAEVVVSCHSKDEIEMLCSDPGVLQDVPSWCRVHGHQVTSVEQTPQHIRLTVLVS